MRLVLLAWVAGVWWLQQAPTLPSGPWFGAVVGGAAAVSAIGMFAAIPAMWRAAARDFTRLPGPDGGRPERAPAPDVVGARGAARQRSGTAGQNGAALPEIDPPHCARTNATARHERIRGGVAPNAPAHVESEGASRRRGNRWRRQGVRVILALCAGVLGFAWAAFRAETRLGDYLLSSLEGRDVIVVGVVDGLPVSSDDNLRFAFDVERAYLVKDGCALPSDVSRASVSESAAGLHDRSHSATCERAAVPARIELVWPGRARWGGEGGANMLRMVATPRTGEQWQLPVRLKAPRGFANWHGFDAELAALARGVRATGFVQVFRGKGQSTREATPQRRQAGPVPGYRFAAWRAKLRDDFRAALMSSTPSARYGGVLMALALGERGDIAERDWQVFADTGVNHLLAISGLHVSLVAGMVAALTGMLWRRVCGSRFSLPLWLPAPKAAAIAALIVAVAYGAVAGWGVPVRRAVGMVAILVTALLSGRSAAPSYVLTWALAVIVTLDPWAVVTPGLWLSFGAVAALVMAGRRHRTSVTREARRASREASRESWESRASAAAEPQRRGRWHLWAVAMGERLGQAARAQYAVTIGLIPLSLAWFGAVPLLGPLANAVAIPVMTLIVTPLALASLLLPHALAQWTLAAAHIVVVWLADWLGTLAAFPWAVWRVAVAPAWVQAAAVGGVIAILTPLPMWMRGWRAACAGIRLAGFALLSPACFATSPPLDEGEFRVTMLDVGQGNAVLVETAKHALLFDAGPPLGPRTDAGQRVIVPYLRAHGIRQLDRLVVSHAHDDHFGGAESVLRAYPQAQLLSSLPSGHRVRRAAERHQTCLAGQRWTWDGVSFQFLHPDTPALREGWLGRMGPNGVSCVLKVANARHSALLAADVEAPQETTMLARFGSALRADILLAPHHGSQTSSTPAFVQAVAPRHVVFQTGYRNRFRHPRPPVVARYQAAGAALWSNPTHGGVRFTATARGIEAASYRERHRRYWHAEAPGIP